MNRPQHSISEAIERAQKDIYNTNAALAATERLLASHIATCDERSLRVTQRLDEAASVDWVMAQLREAGNRVLWRVLAWNFAVLVLIVGWLAAAT